MEWGAAALGFGISAAMVAAFSYVPTLRQPLVRAAQGARWRVDAVPVSGGIAMAGAFAASAAIFWPSHPGVAAVVAAGGVALLVGLVDDVRPIPPRMKLAGQVAAGVTLVAAGVRFPLPGGLAVEAVVTIAWVVVLANAVNLLDNMDGLAAGVAAVAALSLWTWWASGDGGLPAVLPAGLVGSLLGFLAFNLRPARIFMGDSGSLWLGTTLAGLSVVDAGRVGNAAAAEWYLVLGVPAALMALALFDTALVIVERLRHRRPVSLGGSDHASHRLVALGLGPASAVAVLWLLGAAAAGTATLARLGGGWLLAGAGALTVLFLLVGVRLTRVPVYE